MDILIRSLNTADTMLLFEFFEGLSAETKGFFRPHPFDFETVKKVVSDPLYKYAAILDNKIVGYVFFMNYQKSAPSIGICVTDKYHHLGIGSQLLDFVIAKAKADKKEALLLTTMEDNVNAQGLYLKKGFIIEGKRQFGNEDRFEFVMAFRFKKVLQLDNIKTYSIKDRHNLVTVDNIHKLSDEIPLYINEDFDKVIKNIKAAKKYGSSIIFSMGAHVIKNGMSRYLISLMENGCITHISGNGAGSIHDFELALCGGTSEDVPTAIEDGSFGMWEETGGLMNDALINGAKKGLGYGEALAVYIDENRKMFPYRDTCILYRAWQLGIPATYHIAIGTDIIHQHPKADFAAIGACTGVDFRKICYAVSLLDNGVFLNFGSAVIGAEVFLKALSIARNLGYNTFQITTANFDLVNLGDYRRKISYDDPNYYYRPRKNIVNRPTSKGGEGYHFCVDHNVSIPNLWKKLM